MSGSTRTRPNVLITGTPGTGKTTTAEMIAKDFGFTHLCVGDIIKRDNLEGEWDEEYQTNVLDEDGENKLLDGLEPLMTEGGNVVDYHSCDMFPERWFDLVIVLRTDTQHLYDRLQARGYGAKKLDDNMTCEIMNVLLEEARESYKEGIIVELNSNTVEDMEDNLDNVQTWISNNWKPQR
eukprot:CFRG2603T1